MIVPMLDPKRVGEFKLKQFGVICDRIIRSGRYIQGTEVKNFEHSMTNYLGVEHAIAVSSGTDALLLSLMAIGIRSGDEVICPSFTFFATAGVIARLGAVPVFVDILPNCFTCDPVSIEKAITKKTRAIIPVHLFGQYAPMEEIKEIANRHDLVVIEDACQAIGANLKGNMAGTMGDAGCFSFFPSKNLGGFGEGGMVVTNDSSLAKRLRLLRVHGGENYRHSHIGGNFRMDELQAGLLHYKLTDLSAALERRMKNANHYICNLPKFSTPWLTRGEHTYNQFTIRHPQRDKLKTYLNGKGVSTGIYYPIPLHKQECFAIDQSLPETEKAALEVLSLPIASEITDIEIAYVIRCLLEWKNQ